MATLQLDFLRQKDYLAVSITHFFVDVLNNSRNIIMALLAVSIGLTNAQLGIALLLYNVGNALTQPFFGILADRIGPRWLVVGGMSWMIFFYGLCSMLTDWPALIAITVAGIGSGAFHPTGTMVASSTPMATRNRATAVFFMMGQLGLFIGPLLAGLLIDWNGRPGIIILPFLSLIALVSGWQWISNQSHFSTKTSLENTNTKLRVKKRPPQFATRATLLFAVILLSSTASIAAISFAPKLFAELGFEATYLGLLSGLFMGGSALGGIVGGFLGDRIQGKYVIALGMLGTVLPLYFYIPAEGGFRLLLLAIAGFFNGMPHTILVLGVQSLFPNRAAFASGIALGFGFFSGSLGSYFLGLVADNIGLAITLQGTAILPLIAALVILLLPKQPD